MLTHPCAQSMMQLGVPKGCLIIVALRQRDHRHQDLAKIMTPSGIRTLSLTILDRKMEKFIQ